MMRLTIFLLFLCFAASCQNKPTTSATEPAIEGTADKAPERVDLDVEAFKKAISEDTNAIVLDVRTPEETADGMIEGAQELDYYSDDFEKMALELDRSKSYYVYCRSGGRSESVSTFFLENGFDNVNNLLGGYNAWIENQE